MQHVGPGTSHHRDAAVRSEQVEGALREVAFGELVGVPGDVDRDSAAKEGDFLGDAADASAVRGVHLEPVGPEVRDVVEVDVRVAVAVQHRELSRAGGEPGERPAAGDDGAHNGALAVSDREVAPRHRRELLHDQHTSGLDRRHRRHPTRCALRPHLAESNQPPSPDWYSSMQIVQSPPMSREGSAVTASRVARFGSLGAPPACSSDGSVSAGPAESGVNAEAGLRARSITSVGERDTHGHRAMGLTSCAGESPGERRNPPFLAGFGAVRPLGLEPRTCGLRVRCSAN